MVRIWKGPDHLKTEQVAAILSKTIQKPNHSKTEQTTTIQILNMFGIWAPLYINLFALQNEKSMKCCWKFYYLRPSMYIGLLFW